MDINKLLEGVSCSCGRTHTCNIQYVYIEHQAAQRLKDICREIDRILIVADQNTYAASGAQTLQALSGKEIKNVIFPGDEILVPNEAAIQTVTEAVQGFEMIVGIGSGVIQDLCKYVSFNCKVPYIIVATAPSMDGYSSNGAAMITGGMKVTHPAGLPLAILADTEVISQAPMEMIRAGYGDIIGKYSALNDWKLSQAVNGEYLCQFVYNLTMEMLLKVLPLNEKLQERDEESVQLLMEALVLVGIAMSFAGSSRPASGSEHHLSHYFEITGIIDNTKYLPHGIDVLFSTVITARIREKLVRAQWPDKQFRQSPEAYRAAMEASYHSVADGCMELQHKLGSYEKDRVSVYLAKEAQLKQILSEMPDSAQIEKIVQGIGLDIESFYATYGKAKIADAVRYAKDLKDRYSVLWMYYDLFGIEEVS